MVLSKATCPECCERIVVDIVNGYGYCMYCGCKVDTGDAVPLPSAYRNALKVELENTSNEGPWRRDIVSAFDLIGDGDMDSGLQELRKVISDNRSSEGDVMDAIDNQIIEWMVNGVDDDMPYRGGVLDIVSMLNEFTDTPPKMFLSLIVMQFGIKSRSITNPDTARLFLVSVFNFMREYIPLFNNVYDLITVCEQLNDILAAIEEVAPPVEPDEERWTDVDWEAYRCEGFLHQLCFLMVMRIDKLSQKETVKINRTLASKDLTSVFMALDEAFAIALTGRDYTIPMLDYMHQMFDEGIASAPKKGKAGKKARN